MIKTVFDAFDSIDSLENDIAEISVKQGQISVTFNDQNTILFKDIKKLQNVEKQYSITSINSLYDSIYVVFANLDETLVDKTLNKSQPFSLLHSIIYDLKQLLCSCPALEYCISAEYIKIYLDLPNIHVKNIVAVDEKLGAEAILQLSPQRPYLLYVRDSEE